MPAESFAARHLARRFQLPLPVARIIAEHAYANGGAA
jgi:hypothetical protein